MQGLYDRGLSRDEVRQLFRLIDWMLQLPEELEGNFQQEMLTFEEERKMPYVTSIERLAIKKGREEGRQEGIIAGLLEGIGRTLEARFGATGKKLMPKVQALQDVKKLRALNRAIHSGKTLEEIKQRID